MSRCLAAAVLAGILIASGAGAQVSPSGYEVGIDGIATWSHTTFVGGGLTGLVRAGGRTRLALGLFPGARAGSFAGRGELALHYLLAPGRQSGWSFYGYGGLAGVTAGGGRRGAFLLLGLGLESAPGRPSGLTFEAGVGGGARLLVGWRLRRLRWPRPGRH